jgi:hypothetical protein
MCRSRLLQAVALLAALSLTPAFFPAPAAAQQTPEKAPASRPPLPCSGSVNIVRISEIKSGMLDKFLQAVAAQQAWYKNAGMPDKIGVMRIMEQDPATKAYSTSETQVITTHVSPVGGAKSPAHDAAWDAFVDMFKDSSSIKTQYLTCVASM